ncbi:hypothetical protein [Actinoplanes siamensis]|nr:hypothetical protein [Actinoplanes siamensis]
MGFFDRVPPPPAPEPPEPPRPRWERPEAQLGAMVTAGLTLGRSGQAAVGVGGVTAYRNGFEFSLLAVMREQDRRDRIFRAQHRHSVAEPLEPEFLRIGVRFADGRVATNLAEDQRFPGPDDDFDGPLLRQGGGSGDGRRYETSYWVWPLPPPGPLTLVCEWPAFGIGESRAELDGRAVRDAAEHAFDLF